MHNDDVRDVGGESGALAQHHRERVRCIVPCGFGSVAGYTKDVCVVTRDVDGWRTIADYRIQQSRDDDVGGVCILHGSIRGEGHGEHVDIVLRRVALRDGRNEEPRQPEGA